MIEQLGPNIPPGTSAADEAVLRQVFRADLAEARSADAERLSALLAYAERFDDDIMRRAVLTAAAERGAV